MQSSEHLKCFQTAFLNPPSKDRSQVGARLFFDYQTLDIDYLKHGGTLFDTNTQKDK